jgi:ubiquinone/menaquinone biosynthesis C-methylase UbiE
MNPWNELSDQYAGINQEKIRIVFLWLLERLAADPPHVLLDYGTGDGIFPELCSRLPIDQIWAYDPAPRMVQITKTRCRDVSNVQVVTESDAIEQGSVDIVTLNAVWMCLSTEQDCLRVLRDIFRLLKPHGLLIASVTHPCFRNLAFSTYSTDFRQRDYLQDGTTYHVNLFDEHTTMGIKDTHWSIAAMSHQLKEAGFLVEEIIETPDNPNDSVQCEGSPWMVFVARKNHGNLLFDTR